MPGQDTTSAPASFVFDGDPHPPQHTPYTSPLRGANTPHARLTEQVDEERDLPIVNLDDLMLKHFTLLERREINGVTLCVRRSPYLSLDVVVVETFCYITPQRAFGQRHTIPTAQFARFTPAFRHEMFAAFAEQCLLDAERAKNAPHKKERPGLPLPHHLNRQQKKRRRR